MPDEVPEPEPSIWDWHPLVLLIVIPLGLMMRCGLAGLLEW